MKAGDLLRRLLDEDATLWPAGNVSPTRLGWLDAATNSRQVVDELEVFASSVDAERVLLLGMGGSSLGPLVLSRWAEGRPVEVLDTTAPGEIARATEDLSDAFILVSSKSGTTLEVHSLFEHCWSKLPDGSRYAVITDPGSSLDPPASKPVQRLFRNDPNIGGRYSTLSLFGLVPAALAGVPLHQLIDGVGAVDLEEAVGFGIEMAEAALDGQDKLTIAGPHEFGLWAEQLIAESTGKQGKGIVPVPVGDESEGGKDRHHVDVQIGSVLDLGREFYRWMVATAAAGAVLGIDPFDEPDVAAAKAATNEALADLPLPDEPALPVEELPAWLADQVAEGDYVSLQAYLPYGFSTDLEDLRRRCRDLLGGVPVTAGFGPRFLHSTGQLHKGGPNSVVAVQIVPPERSFDIEIPGKPYGFSTLIDAQALGDLRTLRERGRRVVRIKSCKLDEVLPA
ncbi:MAG TPA: hypothetical protein VMY88_03750 [Acidimicrobiales bacterium]|nr:hypothetical protein [Acidimicrobiales bacterium]